MSDNIPFEIQVEIIKRIPVKSLLRFRPVSKAWKSLIDSSDFAVHYSGQVNHLLVRYNDTADFKWKYVSIVDDDTFPQQKVSPTLPLLVNKLQDSIIIGSSHGLLCIYGGYQHLCRGEMVVIWNVSIRKAVAVVLPNMGYGSYRTVLGFGVCRETVDPKIVKIRHIYRSIDIQNISYIPWQVEVFTLSTGVWRSPYSITNLPRKSIEFSYLLVSLDGFIYWLATDRIAVDDEFMSYNLIVSFDLTSEEFREINLPDSLAHQSIFNLYIKIRKSLVVLERTVEANNQVFVVWMMEDGVSKSFTKLFTIHTPDDAWVHLVREFTMGGEPVIEIGKRESGEPVYECEIVEHPGGPIESSSLVVYEPYSKRINNLGINGMDFSFDVSSCMETLLLLDQPDFSIYDEGKRYILNEELTKEG